MNSPDYATLFACAFADGRRPYGYQCRLACGPDVQADRAETLREGTEYRSQLIDIPTGLGKTAGVVLAWPWNRVVQPEVGARKSWQRRMVYCLPMRTLVEQARANIAGWLSDRLWDGDPVHSGTRGHAPYLYRRRLVEDSAILARLNDIPSQPSER